MLLNNVRLGGTSLEEDAEACFVLDAPSLTRDGSGGLSFRPSRASKSDGPDEEYRAKNRRHWTTVSRAETQLGSRV